MATLMAAIIVKARREVCQALEATGAFDSEHAIAYEPPDPLHARQLDLLFRRGIVRDAAGGRYWIDRDAIDVEKRFRITVLKVVFAVAGIAAVVWLAIALLKGV